MSSEGEYSRSLYILSIDSLSLTVTDRDRMHPLFADYLELLSLVVLAQELVVN